VSARVCVRRAVGEGERGRIEREKKQKGPVVKTKKKKKQAIRCLQYGVQHIITARQDTENVIPLWRTADEKRGLPLTHTQ
jgi:hypothetical protein